MQETSTSYGYTLEMENGKGRKNALIKKLLHACINIWSRNMGIDKDISKLTAVEIVKKYEGKTRKERAVVMKEIREFKDKLINNTIKGRILDRRKEHGRRVKREKKEVKAED
jgi:hypothetical protein